MGFGFTLLAVSFFLLILGSGNAVQLLIIINLAISLALVPRVWRDLDRALWTRLVGGAALGIPVGLVAFSRANVEQLKVLAAVAILAFVAMTVSRGAKAKKGDGASMRFRSPSAFGVGVVAGAMTSALGMPGPPVVLYLTSIGAPKNRTRSLTLTFFVVAYAAALILQTATVGIGTGVWATAALLIPVAAVGALLGDVLAKRISEPVFRRVVLVLVALTGAYVLIDALIRW